MLKRLRKGLGLTRETARFGFEVQIIQVRGLPPEVKSCRVALTRHSKFQASHAAEAQKGGCLSNSFALTYNHTDAMHRSSSSEEHFNMGGHFRETKRYIGEEGAKTGRE
jgi:hypothetical protein